VLLAGKGMFIIIQPEPFYFIFGIAKIGDIVGQMAGGNAICATLFAFVGIYHHSPSTTPKFQRVGMDAGLTGNSRRIAEGIAQYSAYR